MTKIDIEYVNVYNPNKCLINMGWSHPDKPHGIRDKFKCAPGDNKIAKDALARIREHSKKCDAWFSLERVATKRCLVQPIGKAKPAPQDELPMPGSLVGFDLAKCEDFISRCDDADKLIEWGQGLEMAEDDAKAEKVQALVAKIKLLQDV